MTAKKQKNTGCENCKHYEEKTRDTLIYNNSVVSKEWWNDCSNEALSLQSKKIDPIKGEYETSTYPDPECWNKDLTCKGFTPIDWKSKYDDARDEIYELKNPTVDADKPVRVEMKDDAWWQEKYVSTNNKLDQTKEYLEWSLIGNVAMGFVVLGVGLWRLCHGC